MALVNPGCLPCDVINGKISTPGGVIFETEFFSLCHAVDTPIPGFVILSSKRHIESLEELANEESSQLGILIKNISMIVRKVTLAERIYCCSVGENIRHLHFYFFPRYSYMSSFEKGIAIFPIAVKKAKSEFSMEEKMDEIVLLAKTMRNELNQIIK